MLVICRRWPSHNGSKPPTRIVNLAVNPATPAAAINVAWAIDNGTVSSQGYGTVQEWPESMIAGGGWGAVQFLSPYLCETFAELRNGELFRSVALGSIANIGPAGQRIRDAFTRSAMPDALSRVALWQHDTKVTQSMAAPTGCAHYRQTAESASGRKLLATAWHTNVATKDASQYCADALR